MAGNKVFVSRRMDPEVLAQSKTLGEEAKRKLAQLRSNSPKAEDYEWFAQWNMRLTALSPMLQPELRNALYQQELNLEQLLPSFPKQL